jgi:hypothetical protein
MACLAPLVIPGTGQAAVAWSNGNVTGFGSNCDFTGNACPGGDTGWSIFDNFDLSNDDTVVAFSYISDFSVGSASDYLSTNWSLWPVDPLGPFQLPWTDCVGESGCGSDDQRSQPDDMTYTFTVTGLSVNLPPGT